MTRKKEIEDAARTYLCGDKSYSAEWETRGFIAGAEWADAHPIHYDGQAMLHVLHKGVVQGKKEMLDKAIEWLRNETMELLLQPKENYELVQEFVDCFKEAMEE